MNAGDEYLVLADKPKRYIELRRLAERGGNDFLEQVCADDVIGLLDDIKFLKQSMRNLVQAWRQSAALPLCPSDRKATLVICAHQLEAKLTPSALESQ